MTRVAKACFIAAGEGVKRVALTLGIENIEIALCISALAVARGQKLAIMAIRRNCELRESRDTEMAPQ